MSSPDCDVEMGRHWFRGTAKLAPLYNSLTFKLARMVRFTGACHDYCGEIRFSPAVAVGLLFHDTSVLPRAISCLIHYGVKDKILANVRKTIHGQHLTRWA